MTAPEGRPRPQVRFSLLGPLEVRIGSRSLPLGGAKQRGILGLLLLDTNRVVAASKIVDALWGDDATEQSMGTLQVHVSNLRKCIAPAAEQLGVRDIIVTQRPGYTIRIDDDSLDLLLFRSAMSRGREAAARQRPHDAATAFADALTLVRGEPLADLLDEEFARPLNTRLRRLIGEARAASFEIALSLGDHRQILSDVEAASAADPFDEHLRGILMVALYRCGRQSDALAVYQDARRVLLDQLGVSPSPELTALESRVLAQDPALSFRERAATATPAGDELTTVLGSSVLVPSAFLVVDGDSEHPVVFTGSTLKLGRRLGNDIVLDDSTTSRLHAEVVLVRGSIVVVDRESANGTRVNGELISEKLLSHGDVISIGRHRVEFFSTPIGHDSSPAVSPSS